MTFNIEPASASDGMHPTLAKEALGILAHEEKISPFSIAQFRGILRPCAMGLPSVVKFGVIAQTAPWTY